MVLKDLIAIPSKIETYSPPKHTGTINRRLVGGSAVPSERLEVVLGELSPGGEAQWHKHPDSEQVFFILEGKCLIQALEEESILEAGMAVRFPDGLEHRIEVLGDKKLRCLVIYSPPILKAEP
jgi:quercetin dioxygenase-like cupin family protein